MQVVRHRQSNAKYAMKTVALARVKSRKGFDFVMSEVDLLKSLDHPNIVRLQVKFKRSTARLQPSQLISRSPRGGGSRFIEGFGDCR